MKVLFLDAYFRPETTAYTHLEDDLIKGLILKGHTIIVLCPTPSRGVDKETIKKYKRIKYEELFEGNVVVKRFFSPLERKSPILRALRYFWINLRTYQIAIKQKEIDIVFSNSTPPTQGFLGGIIAHKLGKKSRRKVGFLYNLQDIFPDSLISTNLTKRGSLLWNIGRRLENATYNMADKIVLISKGFQENVLSKGVMEEKVKIISNWIDLTSVHPVTRKENKLITEFGLDPRKFFVVYAGNFGASQGADIVLKVARQMTSYVDIQFVIFGGGTYFESAKREARDLTNVLIYDLMPLERISEVYSLGDVALITCKSGTGMAGLPSKIWSIMACNTYIIASFDIKSDLAYILQDSGAGVCVEPENVECLKSEIIKKYLSIKENVNLREYVKKHASRDICVNKFIREFENFGTSNE